MQMDRFESMMWKLMSQFCSYGSREMPSPSLRYPLDLTAWVRVMMVARTVSWLLLAMGVAISRFGISLEVVGWLEFFALHMKHLRPAEALGSIRSSFCLANQ